MRARPLTRGRQSPRSPQAERLETTQTASEPRRNSLLIGLSLFGTWVFWGSTYLAIKLALPAFPPFFQMGSRFVTAGLVLLVFTRVRGRPLPTSKEWLSALVVGSLLLGGGGGLTAYAMQTVESGLAASFIAFEPALILMMCVAFGQRPGLREFGGAVLGLVGVVVLMRSDGFSSSPIGLIAMIAATLSWSLGTVLAMFVMRPAAGLPGAASQMMCGGVVLLGLSQLNHEVFDWHPTSQAISAWLYLVVFGSIIAFSAFAHLLTHTRASLAMSYTYVNPLIALLLGSFWGAEHFSWPELTATGIILVGVVLLLQRPAKADLP
jgi:drug/metabolite transporter (DMT)-like permease